MLVLPMGENADQFMIRGKLKVYVMVIFPSLFLSILERRLQQNEPHRTHRYTRQETNQDPEIICEHDACHPGGRE